MRKLAPALALAAALSLASAPSMAQTRNGGDSGVLLATLGGAVVGGALVYYYYPLSVFTSTALGAIVGGAVGSWWYSAADSTDGYASPMPRKSDADASVKPFRLIAYTEDSALAIRPAN
jgi:hypothetical protein